MWILWLRGPETYEENGARVISVFDGRGFLFKGDTFLFERNFVWVAIPTLAGTSVLIGNRLYAIMQERQSFS